MGIQIHPTMGALLSRAPQQLAQWVAGPFGVVVHGTVIGADDLVDRPYQVTTVKIVRSNRAGCVQFHAVVEEHGRLVREVRASMGYGDHVMIFRPPLALRDLSSLRVRISVEFRAGGPGA